MRIVAISDLHLGVGERRSPNDPPEGFLHDQQLAGFIAHLSPSESEPTALLLLGDIFELPGGFVRGRRRPGYLIVELADLLERVVRIAAAHPGVFASLAGFVAAGGAIHVVPGNHDPALAIPEVVDGLVGAIAAAGCAAQAARDQLTVYPGAFHLPGELHAQHGNQFHDINAFASAAQPSRPMRRSGSFCIEDPLGSVLHRLQLGARSWKGLGSGLVELGNALLAIPVVALRSRRSTGRSIGDDPVQVALQPMFVSGSSAAVRRVVRRTLTRSRAAGEPEDYMLQGARQLDAVLTKRNHGVPIYLFGHSHRAACHRLSPNGPMYANTGTWSAWAPSEGESLPYVEITTGAEAPVVMIRFWSADQETVRTS
ncbi:MAG: hypothetical protein HKN03_06510 [Acidimicrobiales bacterium]|nr:hypothetical protein [Acidimicrobiales bacterium]